MSHFVPTQSTPTISKSCREYKPLPLPHVAKRATKEWVGLLMQEAVLPVNKLSQKELRRSVAHTHTHTHTHTLTHAHTRMHTQVLDSVRRRRFRFDHTHSDQSSSQPGPSHQTSSSTCPVCDARLPADEEAASAHVASCLHDNGDSSDSEDVTYEEYTWCDVTRVRATSLLSPEARASKQGRSQKSGEGGAAVLFDIARIRKRVLEPLVSA